MTDAADSIAPRLRITEIFHSLQGEARRRRLADGVRAPDRLPAALRLVRYRRIRSTAANGATIDCDPRRGRQPYGARHVCVTGGEPLAQKRCIDLLRQLCDAGYDVSLETSGAIDVAAVDPRVRSVVDLKAPGSGEVARNLWSNLDVLTRARPDQVRARRPRRLRMGARRDRATAILPRAAMCCFRRFTASSRRAISPNGSSPTACRCASRCNLHNALGRDARAHERDASGHDKNQARRRARLRRHGFGGDARARARAGIRLLRAERRLRPASRRRARRSAPHRAHARRDRAQDRRTSTCAASAARR